MPLAGLRFDLVGPGRVGCSLASWLLSKGARLGHVAFRSGNPRYPPPLLAKRATSLVSIDDLDSSEADFLLLAVPDSAVAPLAESLALRPCAPVVAHVSGALDLRPLEPLRQAGSSIAAFHPLIAFPAPLPAMPREAVFGIEYSDQRADDLLHRLLIALGARSVRVLPEQRAAYHLAATFAAGGVTTLLSEALEIAVGAGLSEAIGDGYRVLAAGALDAWDLARPAASITGPVARGDAAWLERQMATLAGQPERAALLRSLSLATLRRLDAEDALSPAARRLLDALARP